MLSKDFSNNFQRALITGATSGLGKGLARFLAAKNIPLILTGRNLDHLNELKQNLEQKVPVTTIAVDLNQAQERKALLEIISKEKPDLIINNAVFGLYGNCLDISIEDQLKMIEVNISALVEISLHSASMMKQNKIPGVILNISSAASFFPFPAFNIYSASKSFVTSFSMALDTELRPHGIRVLCACPGQIATEFRNRASQGHPQEPDHRTMSVETAVQYLWKQIQTRKRIYIFDWRYRLGTYLFRLIPGPIREKILMKNILKRIS